MVRRSQQRGEGSRNQTEDERREKFLRRQKRLGAELRRKYKPSKEGDFFPHQNRKRQGRDTGPLTD